MKYIFILFLFASSLTYAQSDATLEETIKWLDVYGVNENLSREEYKNSGGWYETKIIWDVHLNSKGETKFKYREKYRSDETPWKDDSLDDFSIYDITSIELNPPNDARDYYIFIQYRTKGYLLIEFADKEKATSLFKALKHLATFYDNEIKLKDTVSLKDKF